MTVEEEKLFECDPAWLEEIPESGPTYKQRIVFVFPDEKVAFTSGWEGPLEVHDHYEGTTLWRLCRRRHAESNEAWTAYRINDKVGEEHLNFARFSGTRMEAKGPLYHLDSLNSLQLLEGMARMIAREREEAKRRIADGGVE